MLKIRKMIKIIKQRVVDATSFKVVLSNIFQYIRMEKVLTIL